MKKDPRVYLAQMLERIERIEQFTAEFLPPLEQLERELAGEEGAERNEEA